MMKGLRSTMNQLLVVTVIVTFSFVYAALTPVCVSVCVCVCVFKCLCVVACGCYDGCFHVLKNSRIRLRAVEATYVLVTPSRGPNRAREHNQSKVRFFTCAHIQYQAMTDKVFLPHYWSVRMLCLSRGMSLYSPRRYSGHQVDSGRRLLLYPGVML